MQFDRGTAERIAQAGVEALERGDGPAAKEHFAQLVEAGFATTPIRLMLARACRASGDDAGEGLALDQVLQKEPTSLPALLMRGDNYQRGADPRAAASFYTAAMAAARSNPHIPADIAEHLERARAFVQQRADDFGESLRRAVEDCPVEDSFAAKRLRHAVDIVTGRREIYLQQPSLLYTPYLPQRQFYEPEEFDWAPTMEAATSAIRDELLELLRDEAPFEPYIRQEANRPRRDFHNLLDDPSWSALYLWKDGRLVPENAARCPRTVAALEQVPLSHIGQRTPAVLFSMLRPGAHIPPHYGMLNCRLICHLPLIVPEGCWLRVGSETRLCEEGKLVIFDDSIEHEAKNESDQIRVILLFEVWRPELQPDERQGISAIFDTIDRYRGVADDH